RRVDTSAGRSALVDQGDQVALLDHLLRLDGELARDAGRLGDHRDLHLHGLEDADLVALGDHLALVGDDLPHVRGDLRADLGHVRTLPGTGATTAMTAVAHADRSRGVSYTPGRVE